MKKVSIVIPVFNTEKFLETCLESVSNQTYSHLEVVIVNDGSEEGCTEYLKEKTLNNSKINLYHIEKQKGVGAARNLGIEKATGDYIYFLDSDDYLPSETIEFMVKYINSSNMIFGKVTPTSLSSSFTISFKGNFKPQIYNDNRFNLIKRNSVLNMLIKRDFLKQENLQFSEENELYSDLSFLVPALIESEQVAYLEEAVYFHRVRNDPVTNPSLSQLDAQFKIEQFLLAYIDLKELTESIPMNEALDVNLLNFYRETIIMHSTNRGNIDCFFPLLLQSMQLIDVSILDNYDRILRKEVKVILHGKVQKFKRVIAIHNILRDVRKVRNIGQIKVQLYKKVFSKLPLKKKLVFFESFLGKNYSDSPKYIYEYMLENNRDFKFVWCFNEKADIPGNAKQVKRFSLKYYYYLARAKYWVSNSRMPKNLTKRAGNIYLQTWHGTPLKKLVFDMNDIHSADPKYKANFYAQSRRWDYVSSPNEYSSEIFRNAFKYDKPFLEYGYPRNDVLYNKDNEHDIKGLKEKMSIPQDKKIVLYAPTWRDDDYFSRGKYNFELQLDLQKMQESLGDDYIVLLRMHYFIANKIDLSGYEDFAYDFSSYDDIAELYLVSDMLITDYSSVFFDYANLKRPILFYMYDLEKYRDKLRGFYLDIENDVPGPILMDTNDIIHSIHNIEQVQKDYEQRYETFYNRFCQWDDGTASERTVKRIFD